MQKFQKPFQDINPLTPQQVDEIKKALKSNANNDGGIEMDPKNTRFKSFTKNVEVDEIGELQINCIKNIPVHYGQ